MRRELIDELVNDTKYSHGVYGCFWESGHFLKETKGLSEKVEQYADRETEYWQMFKGETSGLEFKARIFGQQVSEGYYFKLIFNDRQKDRRPGSHTSYTLLVPSSKVSNIIPKIKQDLSVLIEAFQKIFPDYDRSEGKLTIDSSKHNIS